MEMRIYFSVVASGSTETQDETANTSGAQNQKQTHRIYQVFFTVRFREHFAETCASPKYEEKDRKSPESKRTNVAPWMRRCGYLCGIGLAGSMAKGARERARPLLVEKRHGNNLTSSPLIAVVPV